MSIYLIIITKNVIKSNRSWIFSYINLSLLFI